MKAGLVSDPLDYRWSSVELFNDLDLLSSFVKPAFVFRLLSDDIDEQKAIYSKLLSCSTESKTEDALERNDAISSFRKFMVEKFPAIFSHLRKRKQVVRPLGLELLDDEEIEEAVLSMRGRKGRIAPEEKKARKFLVEQLISRGYKRYEIAEKLGVSVKTVYNILKISS